MPSVNVLMPVYRGDEYWIRTLHSLASCRDLFDQVVVSFDGVERRSLATFLESNYSTAIDPTILVTSTEMSAAQHALWLMEQDPISQWAPEQLVMLLAEDDLICSTALRQGFRSLAEHPQAMLFGSWTDHDPAGGPQPAEVDGVDPSATVYRGADIAARLTALAAAHERTSISGITLTAATLRNHFRQVAGGTAAAPFLSGVRTEFFLATQPSVSMLIQVDQPIVEVQVHALQEGKVTPSTLWNHDEALYQLWLTMTGQEMRPTDRVAAGLRFVKRTLMSPSVLRKVPRAVTVFRETRRED